MNKIASYLNEHILGEALSAPAVRQRFSRDGSIFTITPDVVIHPKSTNDIRKVARFSWQLAEKGHVVPITARGSGSDQTGAAVGSGLIVNTLAHLNKIIYVSPRGKEPFVHTQPGVLFKTLNDTLQAQGLTVPTAPRSAAYSTIGGAVANNSGGPLSGRYGAIGDWVNKLEVVLANGDVIETGRLSRKDFDKKKGLQTFEGEIYRKIDGLIEDNEQMITDKITDEIRDNTGYGGVAFVKQRDGSFDLTPLFIGSQGTLGIISEIVLKTAFYSSGEAMVVAYFETAEAARDAADALVSLQPVELGLIDNQLFIEARDLGKRYPFFDSGSFEEAGAVLFVNFNDFGDGARHRKLKHAVKELLKREARVFSSEDHPLEELQAVKEVESTTLWGAVKGKTKPSLIDGAAIPLEQREEFLRSLKELAEKHHISLPVYIRWLDGVIYTRPTLQLHYVGDKQKAFRLISDYAELVSRHGGSMSADSGEGRLRANAYYAQLDSDVIELYTRIRSIFDPFGTLNPGVKQKSDLKTLVGALNSEFDMSDLSVHAPVN